jgi:hypothetical protein
MQELSDVAGTYFESAMIESLKSHPDLQDVSLIQRLSWTLALHRLGVEDYLDVNHAFACDCDDDGLTE